MAEPTLYDIMHDFQPEGTPEERWERLRADVQEEEDAFRAYIPTVNDEKLGEWLLWASDETMPISEVFRQIIWDEDARRRAQK